MTSEELFLCCVSFFPVITLLLLRLWCGCGEAAVLLLNLPVLLIVACGLWLRSTHLAQKYIRLSGHSCNRGEAAKAHAVGVSRLSPVLPATLSLAVLLLAFWHLVAAVLFVVEVR